MDTLPTPSNKTTWYRITEYNDWEGETWYHYFESDENGEVYNILQKIMDKHGCTFSELSVIELTEDQETILANIEPGYMQIHWFAELTDADGLLKANETSLYKGGIRDFGHELFE